jgi:tRNA threonylcarbamoyl adenosine modification protein YeaZ
VIPKDLLIDSNSSINTDIMNFLSIDCSTDIGSLFIKIRNKTFIKVFQSDKSQTDLLMQQIVDFFLENNISFDDISEILVNQGPGNFSGLRGSIAIAKGLSLSKNLRLFGYNTFIWSCARFLNKENSIYSLLKFRDKYFIKKFDKNLIDDSKIEEVLVNDILINYERKFKVITTMGSKFFDAKILKLSNLNIVNLDYNDLEFLKLNDLLNKDLINPLYLS